MATYRIPGCIGSTTSTPIIDNGTLARTHSPTPGILRTERTKTQSMEKAKLEFIADLGQLVLDITGIIDPTPLSDGTNALISMSRGNWWDAAISVISILPYVGDLAKLGKLPRYLKSIEKAIDIAKTDLVWAAKLRPVLTNLKTFLDKVLKLGAGMLPKTAEDTFNRMKKAIDAFLIRNVGTRAYSAQSDHLFRRKVIIKNHNALEGDNSIKGDHFHALDCICSFASIPL